MTCMRLGTFGSFYDVGGLGPGGQKGAWDLHHLGELARPLGGRQNSLSQIRHTGLSVPGIAVTGP